jgi:hypothetical protein
MSSNKDEPSSESTTLNIDWSVMRVCLAVQQERRGPAVVFEEVRFVVYWCDLLKTKYSLARAPLQRGDSDNVQGATKEREERATVDTCTDNLSTKNKQIRWRIVNAAF